MKRNKALETVMNWWFAVAAGAAVIAFIIPLLNTATDEDPAREAGLFAPVVALCVAAMILAESTKAGGLQVRRVPGIFIGLGSMASAYLWMAEASDVHPRDFELPLTLAILFGLAALMLRGLYTMVPTRHSRYLSGSMGANASHWASGGAVYRLPTRLCPR